MSQHLSSTQCSRVAPALPLLKGTEASTRGNMEKSLTWCVSLTVSSEGIKRYMVHWNTLYIFILGPRTPQRLRVGGLPHQAQGHIFEQCHSWLHPAWMQYRLPGHPASLSRTCGHWVPWPLSCWWSLSPFKCLQNRSEGGTLLHWTLVYFPD